MNEEMRRKLELTKSESYWAFTWRQLKRNYLAMFGLWVVIFLFLVAIFAPLLANDRPIVMKAKGELMFPALRQFVPGIDPYERLDWEKPEEHFGQIEWKLMPIVKYHPNHIELSRRYEAPSREHWLGTDDRGRDLLSRLIWGSRVSLSVGFVAVGIAILIGIPIGAIAGYYGGKADAVILRIIEVVICFPVFFLILTILAFLPQSIFNIMVVIGVTGWVDPARLIRGEFLKIRKILYVEASRAIGASDLRVIFRHILPNAVAPVLVSATFGVAGAILTESALSFLGFGVPPPTPSWGEAISQAQNFIDAWWLTVFPGTAIFLTVTAYNLLGEGLRDATDPRLKEAGRKQL